MEQNLISAYFFLQSYINTGKTFLYNVIYNHFWAKEEIIICVILLGIAVLFFPDGNISYSRFCISLNFT
jgi:thiamine transporter ThiT